jgi:triacylglycerol lipase
MSTSPGTQAIPGRPVLLVHGIMDNSRRFKRMLAALRAAGIEKIHAMDIVPNDGSIPFSTMGKQVRDSADALLREAGSDQLDIVAFSMGTLAARHYLHFLGGWEKVRRFISISGPHHGTRSAYLILLKGALQMRPNSSLLQAMNAPDAPWGEVQVFSFWTPYDLVIVPPESSRLGWADNRTFPVWLHPLMITDRRVIDAVVEVLTRV